ncbi:MAG TPA: ABC transporter permease [Blastocatellia bacterium]|jgi:putative ABC transport system permease protein|nr:ABC transporter permease [Blastocatellia bacterium]
MPNWNHIVREHLAVLRLPPEREIEIVEEQALHLEAVYEDALADGLSETEAESRALRSYDWRLLECELSRAELSLAARALQPSLELIERKGGIRMGSLIQDLRFGARTLVKKPGFTLIAVLSLALGIGPNTAIFSIVYATLLAPAPYPNPDQLVIVWSQARGSRDGTSLADYLEWKEQATSFQYLEPIWPRGFNLATADAPERVRARQTSINGHRMYEEDVWLGRDFAPDEDQPGKNHVTLLRHRLWRERFGSDPGVIGRDIRLDGTPYKVIGVLRPGVHDRVPADLWIPLSMKPDEIANRQLHPLLVTGRLKPGVTIEQAQQEMNVIARRLAERFPDSNAGRSVSVEAHQNNFLTADFVKNLWLLLAAVSFVVLIACVNIANLLLSRGAAREREIAIRAALGATRWRLAWLALTDSLMLATAGGALGALSSVWILQGILAILPRFTLPAEADPRLSLPVLLFTLAATALSGLLCGAAQAWQASRADWNDALKKAGRSSTGSGRRRLRHALVVVEFAMAVTLLAGAGLTILSFWNRTQVDLGVRTDHILTFGLPVNEGRFSSNAKIDGFYQSLLERFQAVPGVVQASVSAPTVPLLSTGFSRQFSVVGRTDDAPSLRPMAGVHMVTPGYFETFGMRLVRGRPLTADDGPGAQRVAVVNERFAKRILEGRDPLGQGVVMNPSVPGATTLGPGAVVPGSPVEWRIVGVFRDVSNLEQFGDPGTPQIYVPFAQSPLPQAMVAVRAAASPEALRPSLAAAVQAVSSDLPLMDVRTMDQIVGERLAPDRLNVALYGGLAALALALAALGIYGVMAYTVAQRTPEIGLRVALGAKPVQVRLLILREGLTLAAVGLALGLAGAYALGRAMQSTLYGTSALSLPVLLVVGLVLLGAALIACYAPARRASAVDPMIVLRQE